MKVGIPGQDDARRLAVIRGWAGKGMDLRVDANEAWSPTDAADRIAALEPFGITSVEQPVPHEEVAALADLRKRVKTPVMLDESLCSEVDAERAVGGGWCDLFNCALEMRRVHTPGFAGLRAARTGHQLGCQVGERRSCPRLVGSSPRASGIRYLEGSFTVGSCSTGHRGGMITFGRAGGADADRVRPA